MELTMSLSSVATATRVDAADPWDAPYFGGMVYFGYHATLPAVTNALAALESSAGNDVARAAQAAVTGSQPADPWDAPYFGGQVYLRYADAPVSAHAPAAPELPAPVGAEDVSSIAGVVVDGANEAERSRAAGPGGAGAVLPVVGAVGGDGGKRRGWLTRFFGRA